MTNPELEGMFNLFFQMMRVQADGLLGISAHLDAVKKVLCELHPEAASRLEEEIRLQKTATTAQFSELQKMIELLRSAATDYIH
jgi:hypothetical protein